MRIGELFSPHVFERALASFLQLYNVRPQRIVCSPSVLSRYCLLYEKTPHAAHKREIRHEGIPIVAAILPPGVIAFEGEVDEVIKGDW